MGVPPGGVWRPDQADLRAAAHPGGAAEAVSAAGSAAGSPTHRRLPWVAVHRGRVADRPPELGLVGIQPPEQLVVEPLPATT